VGDIDGLSYSTFAIGSNTYRPLLRMVPKPLNWYSVECCSHFNRVGGFIDYFQTQYSLISYLYVAIINICYLLGTFFLLYWRWSESLEFEFGDFTAKGCGPISPVREWFGWGALICRDYRHLLLPFLFCSFLFFPSFSFPFMSSQLFAT